MFLNDSNRVIPNGMTTANRPGNFDTNMKIKLYASMKTKMDQDQHRKLQYKVRKNGENEYHYDKRETQEYDIQRKQQAINAKRAKINSYQKDPFDKSYLIEQEKEMKPKLGAINAEQIEK